jgi:lysophospholipase L1-like esterase
MADITSNVNLHDRRDFLKKTALAATAGLTASSLLSYSGCSAAQSAGAGAYHLTETNKVILFQGDSITDWGRNRGKENAPNDQQALGSGYVLLAAGVLLDEYSNIRPIIYNRGISGNKVFQLAERWDKDCIDLKPDLVSILVGVNDFWHTLNAGYTGTLETYQNDYRALLERTKKALPGVTLVICEPFVLKCGSVNQKWFPAFEGYRAAAKKVAAEFKTIFVPFQSTFDEAAENAPPQYWATDGVHPTVAGAHLMAKAWLKTVFGIKA